MKKLYGVITAMTTPFDGKDQVDVNALEKQTEFLIQKGINCLYPTGTTGEMYLMSPEERELVAQTVVKKADGRVPVYIHAGAMTLKETVRLAEHACKIGADGVGIVTPSYFGVNDKAMVLYYEEIAKGLPTDFPIYLYSIPQCAANDLKPRVVQEIADRCKNVVGIKYSYPDMLRVKDYLLINDGKFSVLFGTDRLFLAALAMGVEGTVSGCSGPMPEHFVSVYKAFCKGDYETALKEQKIANEICEIIRSGADMAFFKTVLDYRGLDGGHMRKPLIDLSEEEKAELIKQIQRYL
ncbi:dihydrodipicolinate synthase family protein [Caproicibacter sp.]|uniref:dihydrodipicolinate synthase family protein n=1 Tax=Caproicibacter sp. TaxID=2814884 RepID=UPI003989FE11